jgi:hypothetical protein
LSIVRPSAPSASAATIIKPPRLVLCSMKCRLAGCSCWCSCGGGVRCLPPAGQARWRQASLPPLQVAGATALGCKRLPRICLPDGARSATNGLQSASQTSDNVSGSLPAVPAGLKLPRACKLRSVCSDECMGDGGSAAVPSTAHVGYLLQCWQSLLYSASERCM